MTAVEWLYNHLFPKQLDGFSHEEWNKIDLAFKQAKEMEKMKIIEAKLWTNEEVFDMLYKTDKFLMIDLREYWKTIEK